MERPKCQINGCEKGALVAYGDKWICGDCMMKIINKQKEKQNKEMEELEKEFKNAN
jgi:hypothetical protein